MNNYENENDGLNGILNILIDKYNEGGDDEGDDDPIIDEGVYASWGVITAINDLKIKHEMKNIVEYCNNNDKFSEYEIMDVILYCCLSALQGDYDHGSPCSTILKEIFDDQSLSNLIYVRYEAIIGFHLCDLIFHPHLIESILNNHCNSCDKLNMILQHPYLRYENLQENLQNDIQSLYLVQSIELICNFSNGMMISNAKYNLLQPYLPINFFGNPGCDELTLNKIISSLQMVCSILETISGSLQPNGPGLFQGGNYISPPSVIPGFVYVSSHYNPMPTNY